MKKILACCILVGLWAFCAPVAHAASTTIGAECEYNGKNLSDKMRERVACKEARFTGGQECYVYCDNGTLIYGATQCMAGYYKLNSISAASYLYAKCGTAQEACNASQSPAAWNDSTKKCDCGGNRYEWDGDKLQCVDSAEYTACVATGSGATWDGSGGYCFCTGVGLHWDSTQYNCVKSADQTECEQMASGALGNNALKNRVRWDGLKNRCICIQDASGNAIANPDDYYITNVYKCEKLPSVQRREKFAKNAPAAVAKQDEIKKIITELDAISGKFDRSHWKNADGKFNTARLASDSVAGVVLGTVGGVVTSKVIKKNQIKGGFEDINCTIGGQHVAGYADQFNVGVQ